MKDNITKSQGGFIAGRSQRKVCHIKKSVIAVRRVLYPKGSYTESSGMTS